MTGFSSSLSMGLLVLWTHVFVHRCRNRTYELLKEEMTSAGRITTGLETYTHTYNIERSNHYRVCRMSSERSLFTKTRLV